MRGLAVRFSALFQRVFQHYRPCRRAPRCWRSSTLASVPAFGCRMPYLTLPDPGLHGRSATLRHLLNTSPIIRRLPLLSSLSLPSAFLPLRSLSQYLYRHHSASQPFYHDLNCNQPRECSLTSIPLITSMSWPSSLYNLLPRLFPTVLTAHGDIDTMFLINFLDHIIQQFEDVLDR